MGLTGDGALTIAESVFLRAVFTVFTVLHHLHCFLSAYSGRGLCQLNYNCFRHLRHALYSYCTCSRYGSTIYTPVLLQVTRASSIHVVHTGHALRIFPAARTVSAVHSVCRICVAHAKFVVHVVCNVSNLSDSLAICTVCAVCKVSKIAKSAKPPLIGVSMQNAIIVVLAVLSVCTICYFCAVATVNGIQIFFHLHHLFLSRHPNSTRHSHRLNGLRSLRHMHCLSRLRHPRCLHCLRCLRRPRCLCYSCRLYRLRRACRLDCTRSSRGSHILGFSWHSCRP